nr:DNA cytosine methyltransferase [Frankia sp. CIT1]
MPVVQQRRPQTGLGDPRGQLVYQPMRFIRVLRPAWVALEEVPGVLPIWESFAAELGRLGYATWTGIVSAEEFGVPQTRRRAILLASLLTHTVVPPAPTHARYRRGEYPGPLLPPRPRWMSMADAIGRGLPDRPAYTVTTRGNGWGGTGARRPIREAQRTGRWQGPHDALTVAEFGVLQGFSAGHPWQGSTDNQLKQVGNAVPPGLACVVLSCVARGAALRRAG